MSTVTNKKRRAEGDAQTTDVPMSDGDSEGNFSTANLLNDNLNAQLQQHHHNITEDTRIELQAIRCQFRARFYIVINCYLPPSTLRTSMVDDFSTVLSKIRNDFSSDEFVAVGDFNFAKIKWELSDEFHGTLTHSTQGLGKLEENFLNT